MIYCVDKNIFHEKFEMLRPSPAIPIYSKDGEKVVFKEIQNTISIDQDETFIKLHATNEKINKSKNFDENNISKNSENINCPSDRKYEQSYSFEETFSALSDFDPNLLNTSNDRNDYNEIEEFLVSNNGTYVIDEEKIEIDQDLLLKSIEVVETYNQVLLSLFDSDVLIEKLNLKQLIKSILNLESKNFYFKIIIQSLIRIISNSEMSSLCKIQMFNVNLIDLLMQNCLSIRNKVLVLLKVQESHKQSSIPACDKSIVLTRNFSQIEKQIELVNDLNELNTIDKLDLINHFIDILISKRLHYHSKLEEMEMNIYSDISKLEDLRKNFDLNKFKLDNISKFLIDNDDSLFKKSLNDLKAQIDLQESKIDESKKKFQCLLRLSPFSCLNLESENFSLYFWRFECLKNYLCIEKRYKNDCLNFDSEFENFYTEKNNSEWYLLFDRKSIIEFKKRITTNMCDSNFENIMLKIIASNFIEFPSISKQDANVYSIEENDQDSQIIPYFDDFFRRIKEANFVFIRANLDRDFNSIASFEPCDAYKDFIEVMTKISELKIIAKIENYIELAILLFKMINQKYLTYKFSSNFGSLWLNMVSCSKSLDTVKLFIFLLSENVLWNKKNPEIHCLICNHSPNNPHLNLKIVCNECSIAYHIECFTQNNGKFLSDSNKNSFLVKFFKNKSKFLCCSCQEKSVEKISSEAKLKLQEIDQKASQLNAIKVNKYSLRLNKQRVNNLDKSSSEESICTKPKKRNKKEKIIEEDSSESQKTSFETETESIDLKRARLGLRIRPKTRQMY